MLKFILTCLFIILSAQAALAFPSDHQERKLMIGDVERSYMIHFPSNLRITTGLPVVIVLHGGGSDAESIIKASGFSDKADKEGFMTVYPEGVGTSGERQTWNASHCCGHARQENANDVEFITKLIDELETSLIIDKTRIYVAGVSNGGMLAHRIGGILSSRIAAIGVVGGAMFDDQPAPDTPISVLMIHGLSDDVVPAEGGDSDKGLVKVSMDKPFLPAQAAYNFWREKNGCKIELPPHIKGNITTLRNRDCRNGVMVVLQKVKNGGHNWFGSSRAIFSQFDDGSVYLGHSATDVLWDFFSVQRKKASP